MRIPPPHVAHKVVTAHVIGAVPINVAVVVAGIEPNALRSDSSQNFCAQESVEPWGVNRAEVPKHRSIGNLSSVQILARAPEHLTLGAKISLNQNITAESHKRTAGFGRNEVPQIEGTAGGRKRSATECNIHLLGVSWSDDPYATQGCHSAQFPHVFLRHIFG